MSGEIGRARERLQGPRWLRLVLGATLVAGIALAAFFARDGGGPAITDRSAEEGLPAVMEVRVTLSTDDAEPVEVWRDRVSFPVGGRPLPLSEAAIDLTPWAGRLIRFDVEGEVRLASRTSVPLGYVGCSAQVVDRDGARPLEFIGWHNEGAVREHVGSIGPRSAVSHQDGGVAFWYATEGSLWHVLPATEGSALRLRLKPLLARELAAEPTEFDVGHPAVAGSTATVRSGRTQSGPERPPDVFIYLIDALRADHLGCYGYERNTSPHIDRFAAEAVLFERAYTHTTWTRPAVATVLTGLYPSVHGVHDALSLDRLDDSAVLVPEVLRRSGYHAYCVATNPHVSDAWGFDQGYDGFELYDGFVSTAADLSGWINDRVSTFLTMEGSAQPLFMYVHALEPHEPYVPSPQARLLFDRGGDGVCDGTEESMWAAGRVYPWLSDADVRHLVDLYDAEIHDGDRGFGEFLRLLQQHGRYENALIILTADHGEAFNEHDTLAHGFTFGEEEMHIPLIIRFPGGSLPGARTTHPAGLADLVPTILSQPGLKSRLEPDLPGSDLWERLRRDPVGDRRSTYGEVSHWGGALDLLAVIDGDGYKRVMEMSRGGTAKRAVGLWDTVADPREQVDLTTELPVRASYLEQLLARWLVAQAAQEGRVRHSGPSPAAVSERMRRQLRALGYLH